MTPQGPPPYTPPGGAHPQGANAHPKGANGPPQGAAIPPQGATEPRRTHPLTPLAHSIQVLPVVIAAIIFAGGVNLATRVFIGLAAALLLGLVVAALSYLHWQRFTFWFDDSADLRVDSGLLQRNHQKLQLSRVQSVEVNEPFWARLLGLAEVTVEVAGAGESRVVVRYLARAEAHDLRNEILARAAGLEATSPAAPEQVLTTVAVSDLLLSLLIRTQTLILFIVSGFFLTTAFATGGAGALGFAIVTGGVPLFSVVGEFLRLYGFTVASSPDGLRVRKGLTTTVANTVPPGRVHAVGFVSGPIWRRLGWVRVMVDLGGNPGSGDERRQGSTVLLPVATWPVALEVVSQVLPGVDLSAPEFTGVPRQARWRAPLQWRRIGVQTTDQLFVSRRGWLNQWLTVIPHSRVQSARVTRGPWERMLGLASLDVDTVPGPVHGTVPHLDEATARRILEQELDLAGAARSADGPDRWMRDR